MKGSGRIRSFGLPSRGGVPPISDIELFFRGLSSANNFKVIAITGTDGKSTTAILAESLLQTAGQEAVAAETWAGRFLTRGHNPTRLWCWR